MRISNGFANVTMMKLLFAFWGVLVVLNFCGVKSAAVVDPNVEEPDDDEPNLNDRILNGQIAKAQVYPFQVSLQEDLPNAYSKFCGGVILNQRWVLTAAHCFEEVSPSNPHSLSKDYRINAGIIDAYDHGATSQYIKVKSIFKHPQYDDRVFTNDICLLHLSQPLKYNKYVKKIALPPKGYEPRGSGIIIGWGAIDHAEEVSSRQLRWARIPVSQRSVCTQYFDLPRNAICLGGGTTQVNACAGDSGGPFIQKLKGRLTVAGVTSFGKVGCYENEPIVYTKVSAYVDWISKTIRDNSQRKSGAQVQAKKGVEYPFVAAILEKEDDEYTKLCTGVIVDELWVLTAADCFDNIGVSGKDKLRVQVGSNDIDNPGSGVLQEVDTFYKHKDYSPGDREVKNDLALIKLKNRLKFDSNTAQSFFPPSYFDVSKFDGSILGWVDNGSGHDFRGAKVTTADAKECKKLYPNLTDAHLCVKRAGSECNSDAGAPLIVTKGTNQFVVGMNSVVNKNCEDNKPFLVTNVVKHLDILNNIMSTH